MLKTEEIKQKIEELLQNDPLYAVIQDTPMEEVLYTDPYLAEIVEKKFYSTPEVAGWFGITDAQLRYYIKPFEHYIFNDIPDNPTASNIIRLNFPSILKLRMILLLKDEYRVKGLKRLLGIGENGYVVKQPSPTTELAPPDELANKVELLSNIIQQMMQTGLFNMQQDEETGSMHITVNQDCLAQNIKLLSTKSTEELCEIQERTEKIQKEQKKIKEQIQKIEGRTNIDIAIKIRERQIENDVNVKLRNEALQQFNKQKKSKIFAKLFRSSQVEQEKQRFIEEYMQQHLQQNLLEAFNKYNHKNN